MFLAASSNLSQPLGPTVFYFDEMIPYVWQGHHPSWVAAGYSVQALQAQSAADSYLCVSPDERVIAYIGSDKQVHCLVAPSGQNDYTYVSMPPTATPVANSLQFTDNNMLIFVCPYLAAQVNVTGKVYSYRFERAHCLNSSIHEVESQGNLWDIQKDKKIISLYSTSHSTL